MTPPHLDNISAVSELINNTFSFLHLNIQCIVSKIDLISAEYSCHDITEILLKEALKTICPQPTMSFNQLILNIY
jgi:hypothetical protein